MRTLRNAASWFCLTCRPRTELLAVRTLKEVGHEAFVPTETRYVRIRRRRERRPRPVPLVPGYVLLAVGLPAHDPHDEDAAQAALEQAAGAAWLAVHATSMLRGLLMNRPLRDRDVDRLHAICGAEVIRLDRHAAPLSVGATVLVMDGPYADFEGELVELEGAMAGVLLSIFNAQHTIRMPLANLAAA